MKPTLHTSKFSNNNLYSSLQVNTFQCVLATDGTNTFAVFLYLDINWTTGDNHGGTDGIGGTPAQVGFDAGNQIQYHVLNGSLTDEIINIEERSNIGIPGIYMWQINGGSVRQSGEGQLSVSVLMHTLINTRCMIKLD